MIPVQVNGRTVFVSTLDQLLNFDYQEAIASNLGYDINDPFFASSLKKPADIEEDFLMIEIPDLSAVEEIEIDEEDLM